MLRFRETEAAEAEAPDDAGTRVSEGVGSEPRGLRRCRDALHPSATQQYSYRCYAHVIRQRCFLRQLTYFCGCACYAASLPGERESRNATLSRTFDFSARPAYIRRGCTRPGARSSWTFIFAAPCERSRSSTPFATRAHRRSVFACRRVAGREPAAVCRTAGIVIARKPSSTRGSVHERGAQYGAERLPLFLL